MAFARLRSFSARRLFPGALLGLCLAWLLACYAPGLRQDFFLIDDASLIALPQLRAPLDAELLKTWLTPGAHIDFYPVRDASYWVDIHLLGADPSGADAFVYRLQNFAWLLLCAALLCVFLGELGVTPEVSAVFAGIWLLHPVHSELLMWPSARKDCLALAFGLASALCYLRHARRSGWRWGILAVAFFALSLFSKATFVLLPFAPPIVGMFARERSELSRRRAVVWGAAVLLACGAALIQSRVYSQVTDMRFFYSPGYRAQGVLAALGREAAGWVAPSWNAVDVENWGRWVGMNARFLVPGAVLALLLAAGTGLALVKRSARGLWGSVPFLLGYLPVSTLLFPHRNLYSVRYLEAPALALAIWGAAVCLRGKPLRGRLALAGSFALALCALGTWSEAPNWQDGLAPFLKASSLEPANPSLLHFEHNELEDERKWGHIPPERLELLGRVAGQLQALCGEAAASEPARNSNLCLSAWLDSLFQHSSLRIAAPVERLALANVEQVNPASARRLRARIALRDRLEEPRAEAETGSWLAPAEKGGTAALSSPSQRLARWLYACLDGRRGEAESLLSGWRREHRVDSIDIGEFVSDLVSWSRVRRQDLEGCFRSPK